MLSKNKGKSRKCCLKINESLENFVYKRKGTAVENLFKNELENLECTV